MKYPEHGRMRAVMLSRARAFDEVYTELKGLGYDKSSI